MLCVRSIIKKAFVSLQNYVKKMENHTQIALGGASFYVFATN